MLYLRVVRNYKKFLGPTFELPEAIKHLQSHDGSPLSVYVVSGQAAASRIITLYGMAFKARPEQLDFILIPEEVLIKTGISTRPDPTGFTHPLMAQTHMELIGLETPGAPEMFARAIAGANVFGKRISKNELKDLAQNEIADPALKDAAMDLIKDKPEWSFLHD